MIGPLLLRTAVVAFSAIQGVLTLRLVLPYVDLPSSLTQFVPAIRNLSEVLIEPFRQLLRLLGADLQSIGIGGQIGGGFTDRLDGLVVVALIGWTIVELIVLSILRIFTSSRAS